MVVMEFRDGKVDVDIEEEIRKYGFDDARWTSTRVISSSPFRQDNEPSFFIDLETGGWGDSGAYTEEGKSGNFIELLMALRNESKAEVIEYLFDEHNVVYAIQDGQRIKIEHPKIFKERQEKVSLDENTITISTSPRLSKRGIGEQVQELFTIGYKEGLVGYTAFPWRNLKGELQNVKYRSTTGKKFFYEKGGLPVHNLIYGIHLTSIFKDVRIVVVVEGEIDALSFWQVGIPALAVGGSRINDKQARLIQYLDVDEIVLGGDNDKQGQLLNKYIAGAMKGAYKLSKIDYGKYSDANDVLMYEGESELLEMFNNRLPYRQIDVSTIRNGRNVVTGEILATNKQNQKGKM